MIVGKSLLMLSGILAFITVSLVLLAIGTGSDLVYAIIRHNYVFGLLGSGLSAFIGALLYVSDI